VNYNRGYIGVIRSVVGSTAYLRSIPEFTFTATNLTVYKGIKGIKLKNGTIDVSQTNYGNGINILGLNITIENVTIIGADQCQQGITVTGENIRIIGCDISGFTNTQGMYGGGGRLGYGINAIGRNIKIDGNSIYNCKHCVTSADRYSYTDLLTVTNNVIFQDPARGTELIPYDNTDVFIPPLDVHANVLHTVFENNVITCPNSAINFRARSGIIKDNKIRIVGTQTQRKAVSCSESDIKRLVVENNDVVISPANGQLVYFAVTSETATIENIYIVNNKCDNAYVTFSTANTYRNLKVKGNTLLNCNASGVNISSAVTLDGAEIQDNYIEYNTVSAGNGVITDVTSIGKPVIIKNNKFKNKGASTGQYNIRINTTNKHVIDDNVLDHAIYDSSDQFTYPWRGNIATTTDISFWKGCRSVGDLLVRGGSPPSAYTWSVGDIVYNSSVAASGKIGWVCTTAGTVGSGAVFKPFGAVDA
jgi:formylmethanofuran dehydrogenase subunit D